MRDKLKELIAKHNKPELAKQAGHVTQVWDDGEVTSQKAGDLLWQRTLHCFEEGCGIKLYLKDLFPEQTNGNGYVFTDSVGAYEIRLFILEHAKKMLDCHIKDASGKLEREKIRQESEDMIRKQREEDRETVIGGN